MNDTWLRPIPQFDLPLKWPLQLTCIRHAESFYNQNKARKQADPVYRWFCQLYDSSPGGLHTRALAWLLQNRWSLGYSDSSTPLTPEGHRQAIITGQALPKNMDLPDVILISPYLRTRQTLEGLIEGWPDLRSVLMFPDLRIREQRHGQALLYNDWRIFNALNPKQRKLHDLEGDYYYQYPQGDSVEDVRERILIWIATLIREFAGQKVFVVTHHLTILSILANLHRWSPEEFIKWDNDNKPLNCGVTNFVGIPGAGRAGQGKLELVKYNQVYY